MKNNFGAVILAGGNSERMKYPKPFLIYNAKTFLFSIVNTYMDAGIEDIYVVLNKNLCADKWMEFLDPIKSSATVIENPNPELGRFHSLKLGIKNLSRYNFVFIQNVDNPFIKKEIIEKMQKNKYSNGYTQIYHQGRKGHPLLISNKIIHHIHSISVEQNLRDILQNFPKTDVEVNDERILANINTKEDYEKYFLRMA